VRVFSCVVDAIRMLRLCGCAVLKRLNTDLMFRMRSAD
jgi:hypothetical protein